MEKIESTKNPRVKQWKKLHTKKERDLTKSFIIEGYHVVQEAIHHKVEILELIVREGEDLPKSWEIAHIPQFMVTAKVMQDLSDTETPQGLAAVCKMPRAITLSMENSKLLLLDGIQDPGNIGTLIRTADSAGVSAVILGEGCADPYNSKVIRSTQGSLFHLPILKEPLDPWISNLKEKGIPVFGTSLQNGISYNQVEASESFALLLGNEGQGVNPKYLEQATQNLYIPIYGRAESLNVAVAGGILLYSLIKQ